MSKLQELEEIIAEQPDGHLKNVALELHQIAMHAEYELFNPIYMYANGRINRWSIITRDATIKGLRKEITELRKEINGFLERKHT